MRTCTSLSLIALIAFQLLPPLSAAEAPLVGVSWCKKSGMADRVLKGLSEEIKKRGDPVRLDVKASLADAAANKAAIAAQLAAGAKGIVCLRSDGAKLLVADPVNVPMFIGAAGDPVELKVCTDPAKPDHNITGVTYQLPMDKIFGIYRQVWPKAVTVGLLVQEGHPNSLIEQASVTTWCTANGATCQTVVCTDKAALGKAVAELRGKVDLLVGGNQGLIFDNGQLIAQVAAQTPYVSLAEKPVSDRQALMGVVPDDEKLGRQLAAAIIAVVVDGKSVAEVPITGDANPRLLINGAKVKALSMTIPADLLAAATVLE